MKPATQMSAAKQALLTRYLQGAAPVDDEGIRRRPCGIVAPLSLAQEQVYWRELQVGGDLPLYNECITVRMSGRLEPAALKLAFDEIVRRHEIWRTTFETIAGRPVQQVHEAQSLDFEKIDLSAAPQSEREPEAVRIVTEKIQRPFQLDRGPLLRPTLVKMSESEHRLYLVAHQIILDGMSAYRIFPSELAALYRAFLEGKPSPLPDLPIQYADFACWQRESLAAQFPQQIAFWRTLLQGITRPMGSRVFPAAFNKKNYRGCIESFAFSERTSYRIRQLSRHLNTTEFLVLLSALAAALNRTTGEALVPIGTLSPSGRKRTEVMGLLGCFLNPVTITFDFSGDPTFRDLAGQAQAAVADVMSNDDVPIEHLARELNCEDIDSPQPFFSVAMSLQPPQPDLGLPWRVTTMDVDGGGSPWKLYIAFIDTGPIVVGRAQFNPDIFSLSAVRELVRDLETPLEEAYAKCLRATDRERS